MRARAVKGQRRVVGLSSEHAVVLAIGWPEAEVKASLGFAIQRSEPDGTTVWLRGALGFKGQTHYPGEPINSDEGPFQKLFWADYEVRAGRKYKYRVIPTQGPSLPPTLRQDRAVELTIETESGGGPHQVHFNRAVIASQAYTRNFGLTDPGSSPAIMAWLARGLDKAILGFIKRAEDNQQLSLDVAAYHLDHPDIRDALRRVGKRARVSVAWNKDDDKARNAAAVTLLEDSGVTVARREKVPNLSHNKYMILKDAAGTPTSVMAGSTNFTQGGVSFQNNVMHVIESPELAAIYLKDFELVFADNNASLTAFDSTWSKVSGGDIEVNFSPHKKGQRIDLDRYVKLTKAAKSCIFFATFRATDNDLIKAMTQPMSPNVVVRGLVDDVHQQTPGDVRLYHEAHDPKPNVVAALNLFGIDNMLPERRREGFSPFVHHKFIVLDFDRAESAVITGSANYSTNSTEKNDENTLILHRDPRISGMYAAELFRIYEHYRARWFLGRQGGQKPSELYLKETGAWANKYFDGSGSARYLDLLLGMA
jgi:phosphatidylserine/phosphatidylglycerophosphate/cardiolipin synthase-like enzyme